MKELSRAVEATLRPVEQGDLAEFFAHQNDPEANRMVPSEPRTDGEFQAHWAKNMADATIIHRTILCDGRVAGYVASFERAGLREVCYWLGRAFWGRGVASAALSAFLKLETRRPLWARVAKRNPASARVLEKCGFQTSEEDKYVTRAGEEVDELVFELRA